VKVFVKHGPKRVGDELYLLLKPFDRGEPDASYYLSFVDIITQLRDVMMDESEFLPPTDLRREIPMPYEPKAIRRIVIVALSSVETSAKRKISNNLRYHFDKSKVSKSKSSSLLPRFGHREGNLKIAVWDPPGLVKIEQALRLR